MSDKYIDEIHEIRRRQYEETKNMTPEEKEEYSRVKVDRVKKRLEELRNQEKSKQQPSKSSR